jgi:hypothetical protein
MQSKWLLWLMAGWKKEEATSNETELPDGLDYFSRFLGQKIPF